MKPSSEAMTSATILRSGEASSTNRVQVPGPAVSGPEPRAFVTSVVASRGDQGLALGVVALSALMFVAAIPLATRQLPQVWAFIPAYQAALVVCDLITAALLFGQARFSRSVSLFVLATGYLFSAVLAVAHALSFPGLLAPGGLLGAGRQSTAWLYMFWHAGFPLFVIAYALLKRAAPLRPRWTFGSALGAGVVAILAAAGALTWIATAGESALPAIMQGNRYTPAMIFVVSTVWLLSLAALAALWRRPPHTVLDVWLMVVMCAWLFDIGLAAVFNAGRFDLGFYAGRIYGLLAASFVLVVLLLENGALHARLALAHRELEDLYDHAPCGYHSVDEDGLIVRMNDTWLRWLGYSRGEVVGKLRHADLMTPASAARFWNEAFPLFKRQGWLKEVEFDYRRKDGSTFPGSLQTSAIYDAEGRYLMSRTTVFDISEARRAEEAVRALNQELESFTYSVSHDLRAPLRAVDGYARMLEEDYAARLDDEGRRLLSVVRGSSLRMGRLIDDLLTFARLGKQEPSKQLVHMDAVAREAAEEARDGGDAHVEISELPRAHADRALMQQVWANLLGNAFKYSGKRVDARIEVGGRQDADENVYWVRDNGVGFDMRYAGKLFGVFQRLHGMEEFPGTGVGLAIVQRVVTRHGGRVWAEGQPGQGACFHFSLPKEP
jgi:PAS domain S-box-containing protein